MYSLKVTNSGLTAAVGCAAPACGSTPLQQHVIQRYTYMFCWPCITVNQYSETNAMHFLFNLLRIKGLYMFWALLAHPQEALHKQHLLYCTRYVSWLCQHGTPTLVQPTDITHTQYTKCCLYSTSWGWADREIDRYADSGPYSPNAPRP
jgi:hypothetical protein